MIATLKGDGAQQVVRRVHLEKVDTGADHAFVFYVQNPGPKLIGIGFSDVVSVTTLDGQQIQGVRLVELPVGKAREYAALPPIPPQEFGK
jgi:hypothetical protein